jgi:hypothetical protein
VQDGFCRGRCRGWRTARCRVEFKGRSTGGCIGRIGPQAYCSSEHVYAFSLVKIGLLDKSALDTPRQSTDKSQHVQQLPEGSLRGLASKTASRKLLGCNLPCTIRLRPFLRILRWFR